MVPHDIDHYRVGLLSDDVNERRAISRALAQLADTHHADFVQLCHRLLDDSELRVRAEILWHAMRFGDRDDAVAERKVLVAFAVSPLRARALLALGTIGTQSAFPVLYECSVAGEACALEALARQARTETQRLLALDLSRTWLLSEHYDRREEALRTLRILSTAQVEEDLLLQAYTQYGDELVAWALCGASARMLPILRDLLARWPTGCAQYGDVARAIGRLETRLSQGESGDPALGSRHLGDYL
jgi:hypothetical protein